MRQYCRLLRFKTRKKKIMTSRFPFLAAVAVTLSVTFISCDSADSAVEQDLNRLGSYLDSVKKATPEYTEKRWDDIKSEYNETIAKIDVANAKLSDGANKKLESVKADYNQLKDDYTSHIQASNQQKADAYKTNIRKALLGEEQLASDMQFNFVTGKNALAVYDRFVTTVKENQNTYSREDWDEIKVLYEALDNRKNEIEKDLPTSDNMKIAKLKVQFAGIKSVKRPLSKVDENEAAKANN
jgi:uncharacterized protein DUF6565